MSNYIVLHKSDSITMPVGKFASPEAAESIMKSLKERADGEVCIFSSAEEMAEAFGPGDAPYRPIRAVLRLLKDAEFLATNRRKDDIKAGVERIIEADVDGIKTKRLRERAPAVTWEELMSHEYSQPTGKKAERSHGGRMGAKDWVCTLFQDRNRVSLEELMEVGTDNPRTEVTIRTAITDLKNPKYCDVGRKVGTGILVLKRVKDENGVIYYEKEFDAGAGDEQPATEHDTTSEES